MWAVLAIVAATAWLAERPDAATGLAEELVALFDEVRWADRGRLVLDGVDDDRLLSFAAPEAAEIVLDDLARVRLAWRLYREIEALPPARAAYYFLRCAGAGLLKARAHARVHTLATEAPGRSVTDRSPSRPDHP